MMAKFRLGDRVRVRARLVRDDGAWQRVECQVEWHTKLPALDTWLLAP